MYGTVRSHIDVHPSILISSCPPRAHTYIWPTRHQTRPGCPPYPLGSRAQPRDESRCSVLCSDSTASVRSAPLAVEARRRPRVTVGRVSCGPAGGHSQGPLAHTAVPRGAPRGEQGFSRRRRTRRSPVASVPCRPLELKDKDSRGARAAAAVAGQMPRPPHPQLGTPCSP
eukprot:366030-Chlamydomonas_euryale.AAC.11